MILLKTDKLKSTELVNGTHFEVLNKLNLTIEEYEGNNIFLIKEENSCYEFADQNGWNCVLIIADNYSKNIH